eukprot:7548526-Pyramimonas_sp.AAC.1
MRAMSSQKVKIPTKEECLPGNKHPMKVTNKHFITGNPIQGPFADNLKVAVFGTGCFWGTEKGFWRLPGVYSTAVGYCAGYTEHATYEQVCSGRTYHNEVVQVVYDPAKISYADLLKMFWAQHDPTQGMGQVCTAVQLARARFEGFPREGQASEHGFLCDEGAPRDADMLIKGNDRGTQYRSGIYFTDDEQKALAEASKEDFQVQSVYSLSGSCAHLSPRRVPQQKNISAKGFGEITTEIIPAPEFYYAEDYHQQYLAKPGARPYCSAQPTGIPLGSEFIPKEMAEKHAPKIPESFWADKGPRPGCTINGPNTQFVL